MKRGVGKLQKTVGDARERSRGRDIDRDEGRY
jgi:hypothetical protein